MEALRSPSNLITRTWVQYVLNAGKNRQSVCFTGHRHIPYHDIPTLVERLDRLLAQCYQRGYRDFLSGAALGFDLLAAERVLALRNVHSDVRLVLVLPCSDQFSRWTERQVMHYERLLYVADEIRVLSPTYYEGCMQVRNRHMVDHSSLCICYLVHHKGGAASTVAYAVKESVPILNVAMENADAAFPEC